MVLTTFRVRVKKTTFKRTILIAFLVIISYTGLKLYTQTIGIIIYNYYFFYRR